MNRIILIVGIAIGLCTLALDAYISYVFVDELSLSIQQKNEKLEDMANLQEYLSQLKDAETGQRGYVITGNPTYLEPYEKGLRYVNSKKTQEFLEKSENLKGIQEDIKQLKTLTRVKIDELQLVIDKYNSSGFQAAKEEVSTNLGKLTMDRIRNLIDNIILEQHKALEKHESKNNSYIRFIIDLIVSINIIYLILISISLFILYIRIDAKNHWE
jgi:CHASE3 domain sensor protein